MGPGGPVIPPYGDPGGSGYRPDVTARDLAEQLDRMRGHELQLLARLEKQTEEIAFLRKRTGWILFWVCLITFFGGCAGQQNQRGDLDQMRSDVQRLEHKIDQLPKAGEPGAPAPQQPAPAPPSGPPPARPS